MARPIRRPHWRRNPERSRGSPLNAAGSSAPPRLARWSYAEPGAPGKRKRDERGKFATELECGRDDARPALYRKRWKKRNERCEKCGGPARLDGISRCAACAFPEVSTPRNISRVNAGDRKLLRKLMAKARRLHPRAYKRMDRAAAAKAPRRKRSG